MQKKAGNFVFLLGGHDLEMLTIKELLAKYAPELRVADRNLEWGAKLSDYKDLLNDKDVFIGIELIKDNSIPKHYIEINHHNENVNKPSSLDQIIELLQDVLSKKLDFGKEYERYLILVSANDYGYIPAMLKAGANRNEVLNIRRLDRAAQGVTEEDERLAEESLQNLIIDKGTTIVKSKTKHFSTITDSLYPCSSLLIYTNKELTYYGKGAAALSLHFSNLIKENKAYYGGGDNGFFGIAENALKPERIEEIKNEIVKIFNDQNKTNEP